MKNVYVVVGVGLAACSIPASGGDLHDRLMALGSEPTPEGVSVEALGPPVGEVTLLSTEQPDFPESVFRAGAYLTVSGPASFDIPLGEPGLLTLHRVSSGARVGAIEIPYPSYLPPGVAPNALSVAAPGALGDVFVTSVLAGIYRANTVLGFVEAYSTGPIPDIPPCSVDASGDCSPSPACPEPPVAGGPPCSATLGFPPLPNSLVALADGTLYSTDSFQGAIWRLPSDTRTYELWLTDPQLMGNPFLPLPAGANGIAIGPDGALYIANTTAGPTGGGAIYRVPLVDHPTGEDIELVIAFDPFTPPGAPFALPQGPDGLRFDVDGNLWVSLAFANAIAKLTLRDGAVIEQRIFTHPARRGAIGFNQPSELHLDSRAPYAYVGNHAVAPPVPSDWALFRIATGVRGAPLEKPWLGWDCSVHDCSIDPAAIDRNHLAQLVIEELLGL